MEERYAVLAELDEMRNRAAGLIRAKLEAVSSALRESVARTASELDLVLPPDLEVLFPLSSMDDRLAGLTRPVLAATPALEALRRLDAGRAQSEVLQELLRQLEPWCGPRAIVVFRGGDASGWSGAGFLEDDAVRAWRGALADSPALKRVSEGVPVVLPASVDPVLSGWLEGSGARLLAVPMSLRGKVVGALLAIDGERPLISETVQLLAYLTSLLLETISVRLTVPSSALLDPVELAPLEEELAPAGEEVFAELLPPPAPEPALVAPELVVTQELPQVPDAAATVHLKVSPAVAPAEVALPIPLVPRVALRTPEEERRHEEARRFARLLVSEIRLYNEQAVQEGRAGHDIYHRLKEDIDRSREMYEQRVPGDVRASSNYFFDELVRILADGDPDALGL